MAKRPTVVPKMRGVEALLDQDSSPHSQTESKVNLSIKQITLPKDQPRRYFDPNRLAQLIDSIRAHGILEPILVRKISSKVFELVAGERRLRAAKEIGLREVPVVILEMDEKQALEVSLIENLQREDLNPIEETEGILKLLAIALDISESEVVSILHQAYNAKQRGLELNGNVTIQLKVLEEVLSKVGKFNQESFRSNRLPLLKLPEEILDALRRGEIEYTKARAISRVKDIKRRTELLAAAIGGNLSLKQIKEQIKKLNKQGSKRQTKQGEKFTQKLSQVTKRLQDVEIWKDVERRKKAEKLLDELDKLTTQ
ncbi:ParB/RepB/Spo0J family partition protein (plasmid) [Acaryochloris sp. 'Moss Beach']|uniref:ParB/RepB/Spo0J family partition protein n=1 Tax=Acaryochloris sp. 'Moss Beach' TaxID=2740837 RepID=UPI001F15A087|nr:ParB/RepB/Spo0J family partition protein [Acaryochloris sp. 'Moss Beach']UJB73067.1 ParB/RepB/Spo0J family partition protein [Acaryochloris sp. 'Moss Beach']